MFCYRKIKSSHVPRGWSNDSYRPEEIGGKSFRAYNLDPPTLPVLASNATATPCRFLISNFGHFYFWIPSTYELLYITECYNLEGILLRLGEMNELQTKSLDPLALYYNQHQVACLSLWFWQIPRGWTQDVQLLDDLRETMLG